MYCVLMCVCVIKQHACLPALVLLCIPVHVCTPACVYACAMCMWTRACTPWCKYVCAFPRHASAYMYKHTLVSIHCD